MWKLSESQEVLVKALWGARTCGELVASQEAIVIDGNLSVEAACEVLVKNNILSAPVSRGSSSGSSGGSSGGGGDPSALIGIFTYNLLLKALLQKFANHKRPQEFNLTELLTKLGPKQPVSTIISDCEMHTVFPNDRLDAAVTQFGRRAHRTAVVDANAKFLGMISQGMLLKYLLDNRNQVEEILATSLRELGIITGSVLTVSSDSLVIEGVRKLIENKISSIAITNPQGIIIGNISLTDVKYILRNRAYHAFWLEADKFLGLVMREQAFNTARPRDSYPVFTVHADKSLLDVAERMVALRTHRLWVVEDSFKPSGVISITDIMRFLTPCT